MDYSTIIGPAAILAAIGGIVYKSFDQISKFPKLVYKKLKDRLIYSVRVYQYDELFEMIEEWLSTHHQKLYRDVEATTRLSSSVGLLTTTKATTLDLTVGDGELVYKQEDNTFIINYKRKKILINKSKDKVDGATSMKDLWFRKYSLSGWKAKKQIDLLLREIITLHKSKEDRSSIRVYGNDQYGQWYSTGKKKTKSLERTIICSQKKKSLKKDIDSFVASEDWYTEVCIPYKRGYCFYGPPGTGKTTIALAIANYTGRPIFSLNLNSLESDPRIPPCFSNIEDRSILLIEDIDKIFSGRENVQENSKISFSSLLNCLDGVFYRHGVIVVITTNHIEKLDEALLRTGRIDMKMEIPLPTDKEISEYLSVFYGEPMEVQEGKYALKMSDVQEICLQNRYSLPGEVIKIINRDKKAIITNEALPVINGYSLIYYNENR